MLNEIRKITVLGSEDSGKNLIILRMVEDYSTQFFDPTNAESYICSIKVDDKQETLDISTTVQISQHTLQNVIRESNAFLLVYSVNKRSTFEYAENLYNKKILRNKEDEPFNIVLVGNRMNRIHLTIDDENDDEKDDEVPHEMGAKLAESWQVPFIEVSSTTRGNVGEAFDILIREMRKPSFKQSKQERKQILKQQKLEKEQEEKEQRKRERAEKQRLKQEQLEIKKKKEQEMKEERKKRLKQKKEDKEKEELDEQIKDIQQHADSIVYQMQLQRKQNMSVLQTILIALFSTIGSIALTDSLGLDDEQNGSIALIMSALTFFIATMKLFISWRASNKFEKKLESKIISTMRMKSIAVLMATITDSVFDALQGIAAMKGEFYTNNALYVLLVATWIGVTDEIIETFIEIFFLSFAKHEKFSVTFCMVFLLWCLVESSMGIYLLSSYQDTALKVCGIIIETILLMSICCILSYTYWKIKKDALFKK